MKLSKVQICFGCWATIQCTFKQNLETTIYESILMSKSTENVLFILTLAVFFSELFNSDRGIFFHKYILPELYLVKIFSIKKT